MGTSVIAALDGDTKPNYTVATVVAGSFVVADTEFGIFVGNAVQSQLEAFNGLEMCKHALRDAGWPNPVTTEKSAAVYDTATNTLAVTNGAPPTVAEDDVAIFQGLDFTQAGDSNSGHATRMAEQWLESVAKVA
jgi:hypothetical protein